MSTTENPVRGTVRIDIDGETYTMRLNWHGIAQVRQSYPDGYNLADPRHLSVIMSIAMAERHPEMTPDRIMDLSPPLEHAISAVGDMINYSWWGQKDMPEEKDKEEDKSAENPQMPRSEATAA